MVGRARGNILCDAWRIARSYWSSEERWSAWGLLVVIVTLHLSNVFISVQINHWNRSFYNALQTFDSGELLRQLGIFCVLVTIAISLSVYAIYFNQMLQIRWRRWLTRKYLGAWMADRAYYQLQLGDTTDNPDQRIADDVNQFTTFALSLSFGILTSVVSLGSFLVILWGLSGPLAIPISNWATVQIPGYLVWAALLYAGIGTWLTMKIGRSLVPLNFARQRYEGDFRFSLVRLRENAESVALYGGEPVELGVFHQRFGSVFENFRRIMERQKRLNWFTLGYAQVAIIFPVLMVSPNYFARQIALGGLMQVVNAFSFVHNSLSFIINAYADIAAWQAVTQRLSGFQERLSAIQESIGVRQQMVVRRGGSGFAVTDLDIDLPDGTPLLRGVNFTSTRGDAVLVTGPTGAGKSTLLRAIAGIWPFGRGQIRFGENRVLLVPQRPYLPLGTLTAALLYPHGADRTLPATRLIAALEKVGLGALAGELNSVENWPMRLSLGEQQRLAFARILLTEPALLFLDEATSALDEPSEAQLYELLRTAPWRPSVISVGHRSTLLSFHDSVLDLAPFTSGREQPAGKSIIELPIEILTASHPTPPWPNANVWRTASTGTG